MADHVGVYQITGIVIPTPATRNPISLISGTITSSLSAGFSSSKMTVKPDPNTGHFPHGGVNFVLSSSAPEVSRLNAFYSGTEKMDPSASSPTDVPLYYSKVARLHFLTASKFPTLEDVFNNRPDKAPWNSQYLAPFDPSHVQLTGNLCRIGTTLTAPAGRIYVGSWTTYVSQTGLAAAAAFPTQGVVALSANLIQVGSKYAAVTGVYIPAPYDTLVLFLATGSNGQYLTQSGFTASAGMPVNLFSWQELSSSFSGVFCNKTVYEPTTFSIPVTSSGKIRDMRVRVELLHDERLNPSSADHGLQGLSLAIRSPNTAFRAAHPLWNVPAAQGFPVTTNPSVLAQTGSFGTKYSGIPSLLQNSYLLWSGRGVDDGLMDAISIVQYSASYHTFDTDIDMRTIFWDASPVSNPRDIGVLFPNKTQTSPGAALPYDIVIVSSSYRQYYQSPTYGATSAAGIISASIQNILNTGSLTCSNIPWMMDTRNGLPPGNLSGTVYTVAPLPPLWAPPVYYGTSGTQLGPQSIRPVYPILDDVYVYKVYDAPNASTFQLAPVHAPIVGFRPGLRNTDLSGTWQFLVGVAASAYNNGYYARENAGVWLRQARLEVVYDVGLGTETFIPSSIRRYTRPVNVKAEGFSFQSVSSGNCAWDVGLNYVQELNPAEYGRTVALTDASQSNPDSYAVMTYITGTLWTELSASGVVTPANPNPAWWLGYSDPIASRPAGLPYVPDSYVQIGATRLSASQIDILANLQTIMQQMGATEIPPANDVVAYLKRNGYTQTEAARWAGLLDEALAAATASSYF